MCGRPREDHLRTPRTLSKSQCQTRIAVDAARLIRDARHAPGARSLRGGARAQGGDATRGMAGSGVRSGITKSFRVLATDAPPIRREAWATLQEWVVCSSIFVVGRGVKAGLPGSMPRGTLNERSERVDNLRRSSGRRTAYICAASSAAALAVPQPQRCPAVAALKQLWRKRRRQHRAAGGLVAPCDSVDASAAPRALGGAACSSMQVAEQWARCWHAAIRAGSHAFHL